MIPPFARYGGSRILGRSGAYTSLLFEFCLRMASVLGNRFRPCWITRGVFQMHGVLGFCRVYSLLMVFVRDKTQMSVHDAFSVARLLYGKHRSLIVALHFFWGNIDGKRFFCGAWHGRYGFRGWLACCLEKNFRSCFTRFFSSLNRPR